MRRDHDQDWLDRATVIALGSNLAGGCDSREVLLEAAVARLGELGLPAQARSSWWASAAWPDAAQPEFLNGVMLADTILTPLQALEIPKRVEREFGRKRSAANAPRTLDLDLIAHGREAIETGPLILPHPRAGERRFVMGPLAEIAPDWRHPLTGERAATLEKRATVGSDARPCGHAALHKSAPNAI